MKNEIDNVKFVCMVNLNCILATYLEWGGQKAPPTYNKQRVQGKNPLLEQHFDGDISNAYLAVAGDC